MKERIFQTTKGEIKFLELEDNRNFKKGDTTFLPIGFSFKIEEVKQDKKGLYCMDGNSKRYIHFSTYSKWDNSLIKELGFRKIQLL